MFLARDKRRLAFDTDLSRVSRCCVVVVVDFFRDFRDHMVTCVSANVMIVFAVGCVRCGLATVESADEWIQSGLF